MSEEIKIELPVVIPLQYPVILSNKDGEDLDPVDELVISRRPKYKDYKGMKTTGMTFDDLMLLAARITNQPKKVIEELDMADMMSLSEVINSFLPETGQETPTA